MFLYNYYPGHVSKVNEIYSLLYVLFLFSVEFIIYMQNGFATIDAVNILYTSVVSFCFFPYVSNKIYLWIYNRKMPMAKGWIAEPRRPTWGMIFLVCFVFYIINKEKGTKIIRFGKNIDSCRHKHIEQNTCCFARVERWRDVCWDKTPESNSSWSKEWPSTGQSWANHQK